VTHEYEVYKDIYDINCRACFNQAFKLLLSFFLPMKFFA